MQIVVYLSSMCFWLQSILESKGGICSKSPQRFAKKSALEFAYFWRQKRTDNRWTTFEEKRAKVVIWNFGVFLEHDLTIEFLRFFVHFKSSFCKKLDLPLKWPV